MTIAFAKAACAAKFTFASVAYVKRAGSGIGSDPRNMGEALDTRPVCLACEPFGRFHMHGVKCLRSTFDVETDSIHNAVSSGHGSRHRAFVVDIGEYRAERGPCRGAHGPVRMP